MHKSLFVFALVAPALLGCSQDIPPEQAAFLDAIEKRAKAYDRDNELKADAIEKEANAWLQSVKGMQFADWVGRVDEIDAVKGGAGVELDMNYRVQFETINDDSSRDNTIITTTSPLYPIVSQLDGGQKVLVSGAILYEHSITDMGRVIDPEFYVRFTAITPID